MSSNPNTSAPPVSGAAASQQRTYKRSESAVFFRTKEKFGGLSNMAAGFPLCVNGVRIRTSEALYQACRFPHLPDIQKLIIEQLSPMTAKMVSKPYRKDSRQDWERVRVKVMRWCLRVKLAQNWTEFSGLLLATGDRPIVEESRKDDFWGAKIVNGDTLVGINVLGRLLMELREEIRQENIEQFLQVEPLPLPDFLLFGGPIRKVEALPLQSVAAHQLLPTVFRGSKPVDQEIQLGFLPENLNSTQFNSNTSGKQRRALSDRLQPYRKYKDTELPWLDHIPITWRILRGKGVFSLIDIRSETGNEEMLTVSASDGVVPRRLKTVTMFMAKSYVGHKLCWPGDLVVNSLWAWMQGLGVAQHHGLISSAYSVYRPRPEFAGYAYFFHYLLRSVAYKWELQIRSKGIWLSRLQLSDLAFMDMPIILPPPNEQTAVVRFLDYANRRIDRFIRTKKRVIALLNEQKQNIIQQVTTRGLDDSCPVKSSEMPWLGSIPQHWELRKLKFEMTFRGGGTPSKGNAAYWNGDIPWVSPKDMKSEIIHDTADHITRRAIDESSTNLVPAGSLLMVVRSGILQRTIPIAICSREVALNQDMKALSSKGKLSLDYFMWLVRGSEKKLLGEWTKQGATVESIEHQFLANTKVPIPPLDEQCEIVQQINIKTQPVNAAIRRAQREIDLVREYRTRLTDDVVTGKLDVREVARQLPSEIEELKMKGNEEKPTEEIGMVEEEQPA